VRALVAIAHYGTKNRPFLDRVISEYQAMEDLVVDMVVLTEVHKPYLPSSVRQVIGLPDPAPWSLPFGHRPLFIRAVDDYDLFIYSEDDTLIEWRNIEAFLQVSASLPDTYLPGFTRYEVGPHGERNYNDVHSRYHWDPTSVFTHDGQVFASFTNEHSACYVLTAQQLRRCIRSGGFVTAPHEGPYDMLVSAATDPYTRCGLRKVLSVSRFEDFTLHHLPNAYVGRMGIWQEDMDLQRQALSELAASGGVGSYLFDVTSPTTDGRWDKDYYAPLPEPLASDADLSGRSILSIGVGSGDAEAMLIDRGAAVTGVPLDPIVARVAEKRGIRCLPPHLDTALASCTEAFDGILLADVLPHVREPTRLLAQLSPHLVADGELWATARNADHERVGAVVRRRPWPPKAADFERSRVHPASGRTLRSWLRGAGYRVTSTEHWSTGHDEALVARLPRHFDPLTADRVLVRAAGPHAADLPRPSRP
jgi:2-polyprenyl-3-methyl-5-hydroxy-6-metoxy-1,4-benzoquinol methylase